MDLVSKVLAEEAGNSQAEWVLWAGVRTMISNAAFAFPVKPPVLSQILQLPVLRKPPDSSN